LLIFELSEQFEDIDIYQSEMYFGLKFSKLT